VPYTPHDSIDTENSSQLQQITCMGIEFVLDADQIQRICWNRVHITKITKNELTDGTVLIRSLKICD
jgi:hypothetical protein